MMESLNTLRHDRLCILAYLHHVFLHSVYLHNVYLHPEYWHSVYLVETTHWSMTFRLRVPLHTRILHTCNMYRALSSSQPSDWKHSEYKTEYPTRTTQLWEQKNTITDGGCTSKNSKDIYNRVNWIGLDPTYKTPRSPCAANNWRLPQCGLNSLTRH